MKKWVCFSLVLSSFSISAMADWNVEAVVKNNYIVVFRDDTPQDEVDSVADSLVEAQANDGNSYKFHHVFKGFSAKLNADQLNELKKNPSIETIEPDSIIKAHDFETEVVQQNATWGIDRIDQKSLPLDSKYNYTETGANANVYVLDTGILLTHQEFEGRAKSSGFTAIKDGRGTNDCKGHGTHVSGTIGGKTYGVAKKTNLWAVRVLDCNGSGSKSGSIAAIDWVIANQKKPAVINMSLGGSVSSTQNLAVKRAYNAGIVLAISAGNDTGDACNVSPASAPEAITVGATVNTDSRLSYSNFGKCVDIFAPGGNITSSFIGSNTATRNMSGTSMSSPHVAGVAALYRSKNPNATPAQVAAALTGGATQDKVKDPRGTKNLLLYSLFL